MFLFVIVGLDDVRNNRIVYSCLRPNNLASETIDNSDLVRFDHEQHIVKKVILIHMAFIHSLYHSPLSEMIIHY